MDAWARLAGARVARFATVAPDGRPVLVPVCFAVDVAGATIYHAVDHKPKATRALARLRNLAAEPRASLLADHYDDGDWDALWWVRADGEAEVLDPASVAEARDAIDRLVEKYPQYAATRPDGPVVALHVAKISSWNALGRSMCGPNRRG